MTTNTDINSLAQRLRDAALKATKGLWYRAMMRFNGITTNEITSVLFHGEAEAIIASTVEKRDAEFIALANPINIQLILNALESAQRQVTHLEKCLSEQENISSGFHVGLKYASARIKELEASQPVVPNAMPMQPIIVDEYGTHRFKANAIVNKLQEVAASAGYGLNAACLDNYSDEDWMQLAQLIGYSITGYSELSYVSDESYSRALSAAPALQEGGNELA